MKTSSLTDDCWETLVLIQTIFQKIPTRRMNLKSQLQKTVYLSALLEQSGQKGDIFLVFLKMVVISLIPQGAWITMKFPYWLIGPWKIWLQSQMSKFQTHFNDKYLKYFLWNCYQVNATTPQWSTLVNIGSGNDLVPSGNKPLPGPMLTQIYLAIWHH